MKYPDALTRLIQIMARLRAPDGCPWDREQTLETLRPYLVEETFEVLEALETGTPTQHCEELGDLLLQIVFQSRIREEQGHFDVSEVATAIADKLERRHPHVFGDAEAQESAAAVARTWGEIKAQEKWRKSALDGVPLAMPALLRARRLGEKAAGAGFDWRRAEDVLAKVDEERAELAAALESGDQAAIEAEIGDYLFSVVNLCRHLNVEPEAALRGTSRRFEARFRALEAEIKAEGKAIRDYDDEELERRWQAVKRALRGA